MTDLLATLRLRRLVEINRIPADRETLILQYGQVWDAEELARDFEVLGYLAPFVVVRRRADGQVGSCEFQHQPRFYFRFETDGR